MPEMSFSDFLRRSFAILEAEIPRAYGEMCRRLSRQQTKIVVDGESCFVRFAATEAEIVDEPLLPSIEASTDSDTILDLIEARTTLAKAVINDRLRLRGSPERLLEFHDGLLAYLHGAVRAPSFPALLAAFRSTTRGDIDANGHFESTKAEAR